MNKMIILLSGRMRTGKNTLASFMKPLFETKGKTVVEDSFALLMKDSCKEDFKRLGDVLKSINEEITAKISGVIDSIDNKHNGHPYQAALVDIKKSIDKLLIKDESWYDVKTPITRAILQVYGTNIFRQKVDVDYWVKKTYEKVKNNGFDITCICDTRFPNEIENMMSDDWKAITIRINRKLNYPIEVASHPSETSLDDWTSWDYVIDNNGSLEDLKNSAKTIVEDILK